MVGGWLEACPPGATVKGWTWDLVQAPRVNAMYLAFQSFESVTRFLKFLLPRSHTDATVFRTTNPERIILAIIMALRAMNSASNASLCMRILFLLPTLLRCRKTDTASTFCLEPPGILFVVWMALRTMCAIDS